MIRLKITGMTCDHCVQSVTKVLAEVSGVEKVIAVDRERGEAIVAGSPDAEQLVAAVKAEGYEAWVA